MKALSKVIFFSYLLVLVWVVLFKLSVNFADVFTDNRSYNTVPFANYNEFNIRELIYNFLIFIPFGLFLSVAYKAASFWGRLAIIFCFSLAVEALQYVWAIGATDITDVISNTSGGFVGLVVYAAGKKIFSTTKLDRGIAVGGMALLLLCMSVFGVLHASGIRFQLKSPSPPNDIPYNRSLRRNQQRTP